MAGNNNNQFPEIFNDGRLRIYRDSSQKICIEDVKSGVSMTLNAHPHGGLEFRTDDCVETIKVFYATSWKIVPRH